MKSSTAIKIALIFAVLPSFVCIIHTLTKTSSINSFTRTFSGKNNIVKNFNYSFQNTDQSVNATSIQHRDSYWVVRDQVIFYLRKNYGSLKNYHIISYSVLPYDLSNTETRVQILFGSDSSVFLSDIVVSLYDTSFVCFEINALTEDLHQIDTYNKRSHILFYEGETEVLPNKKY